MKMLTVNGLGLFITHFYIVAWNPTSEVRLLYSKDALKPGTLKATIMLCIPQHYIYHQENYKNTKKLRCDFYSPYTTYKLQPETPQVNYAYSIQKPPLYPEQ